MELIKERKVIEGKEEVRDTKRRQWCRITSKEIKEEQKIIYKCLQKGDETAILQQEKEKAEVGK